MVRGRGFLGVKIPRAELKALLLFTTVDDDYPQLASLALYPNGTLAASNGHTLVIRGELPEPEYPKLVHPLWTQEALRGASRGLVDMTDPTQIHHPKNPFPQLSRLVPKWGKGGDPDFYCDSEYLALLDKVARAARMKSRHWRIWSSGTLDPIRCELHQSDPLWTVVIMPVRVRV